jgi:hypothetical protein
MVYGPDGASLHIAVECDLCGVCPIRGVRHRSLARSNFDLCAACRAGGRPEVAAAAPYDATGMAAAAPHSDGPAGQQIAPAGAAATGGERQQGSSKGPHQAGQRPQPQGPGQQSRAQGQGPEQHGQGQGQLHQHQPLVDWVWRYFSGQHQST